MSSVLHSIVIPVFNEVSGLDALFARMRSLADVIEKQNHGHQIEVILVNDGSRDGSAAKLDELANTDSRFKVLHFSRNFGHQIAISAGLEWATGQTVTVMDGDLQDPPEVILEFIEKWREGFEVIYAVRRARAGETVFKLWTAKIFYRLIRKLTNVDIPVDTGDFRLMDRRAVDAFLKMRERHRFVRGMVSWVGFRQAGVLYDRSPRSFGQTHYPFRKMLRFALDGITSFSTVPLQVATYVGLLSAAGSFFVGLWALYTRLFTDRSIQGWTSLILVALFLGGVQLMALGILGEYIGRIYDEVKHRPLYFVAKAVGFERSSSDFKNSSKS